MTRERWEQILFAHVPDEVVQDMLNAYVLELEAQNDKLRELVRDTHADLVRLKDAVTTFDHEPTQDECVTGMLVLGVLGAMNDRMRELGVPE